MQCLKQDGSPVLHTVQMAHTFWTRFRGLLGRTGLDSDEGLLIVPCNSVHTLGMKFAIGVVFLTRDSKVCHLIPEMSPGKLSPLIAGAHQVLELHPGTLAQAQLQVGDSLTFK
jgi:uncharacterized membrane protein (UPF0127 family)